MPETELIPMEFAIPDYKINLQPGKAPSVEIEAEVKNKPDKDFNGRKCIPKIWSVQDSDLRAVGLGHHIKPQIPFTIVKHKRVNLGTGCENTLILWFEGQTKDHHFLASHYKLLSDD